MTKRTVNKCTRYEAEENVKMSKSNVVKVQLLFGWE